MFALFFVLLDFLYIDLHVVARRSISFDGKFVYVTSPSGSRLMKLGSGLRGTLRYVCIVLISVVTGI